MSTLVVLGYPSEAEATSAYQKILDLDKNLIVSLQSIAVVAKRADGKCDVVTPDSRVGTSAVWGLFWGALLGLIFFVPFVGAALGAGIGALTGVIVKRGVDKDFQERVRNLLSADDSAAVFMVVDEVTTDKFVEALRPSAATCCRRRCPSRTRKSSSTPCSRNRRGAGACLLWGRRFGARGPV